MLENIVIGTILFSAIGSVSNRITGGTCGLLHNAFVGFLGFLLAAAILRVTGYEAGVVATILILFAGGCMASVTLHAIGAWLYKDEEG